MNEATTPHPGCYWVSPGKFLAGNYPGDKGTAQSQEKLTRILDSGVRCFINLMKSDETDHQGDPFQPYKELADEIAARRGITLRHVNFPITDQHVPTPELMHEILDCIDSNLEADRPVYLHCWGGHGRTGTVVACRLIKEGRATKENFVSVIANLRHNVKTSIPSPENAQQRNFVTGYTPRDKVLQPKEGKTLDRYLGCLMGLAVGDAVGTTLEFKAPGTFTPIDDMVGGGPFQLNPGEWTDDTTMALCLAESLIEKQGFDPIDQLQRYIRWYRDGYLSAKGHCFDIGGATQNALCAFEKSGEPWSGSTSPNSAGNGSLMRLAPVPMAFANAPRAAFHYAADSSRTTHGATEAVDACRYFGGVLIGALRGESKETLLSTRYSPVENYWNTHALSPKIYAVASGSFKEKEPPEIKGSGYVVLALEAALWAFHTSKNFRDGCLLAANLGDDADTTAAIYGQIAGAYYGASSIPQPWREKLYKGDLIEDYARRLYRLSLNENLLKDNADGLGED